ncbi:MAG: quinoprotein dehydrogenase-associated putative ABC transporter substrate-binding protein [Candidatus Acidiferrum sp.]
MYSAFRQIAVLLCCCCAATAISARPFRVCADPDNLPFSNEKQQGFENELAKLVAHDLGEPLQFVWEPQHGDFLRRTLTAGLCDAVMGLPSSLDEAEMTVPYYRSTYVFVTRDDRKLAIHSFDDPGLRSLHIGVQLIGHDSSSVPPAQVLFNKGLASNIVWYRLLPDFSHPNPPVELIDAVERGDIDMAIAWGPMAGFFAKHSSVPLKVTPVSPQMVDSIPLTFQISMGVRHGQDDLRARLNTVIQHRKAAINSILQKYGVPTPGTADSPKITLGR